MLQKVVVVVLHSPSNVSKCWNCGSNPSLPFCSHCGKLQDLPENLGHFDVFGLTASLKVDGEALKAKFYELSRQLHPDKYAATGGAESIYSLRWTSRLNKAYQVLRDPEARGEYLLQVAGQTKSTEVPVELAETYFDLQDLLEQGNESARVKEFRDLLTLQLADLDRAWVAISQQWDGAKDKALLLSKLANHLTKHSYLRSMLSDLDKKWVTAEARP